MVFWGGPIGQETRYRQLYYAIQIHFCYLTDRFQSRHGEPQTWEACLQKWSSRHEPPIRHFWLVASHLPPLAIGGILSFFSPSTTARDFWVYSCVYVVSLVPGSGPAIPLCPHLVQNSDRASETTRAKTLCDYGIGSSVDLFRDSRLRGARHSSLSDSEDAPIPTNWYRHNVPYTWKSWRVIFGISRLEVLFARQTPHRTQCSPWEGKFYLIDRSDGNAE
jgi:hypothetical protein